MDEILELDNELENGADWLSSALTTLGDWCYDIVDDGLRKPSGDKDAEAAYDKVNGALALITEARAIMANRLKAAQDENDRLTDLAEAQTVGLPR